MRKSSAILGSALFFVIAPGTVAGLLPWWISRWAIRPAFLGFTPLRFAGAAVIAIGLVPLVDSFRRFAVEGLGTPGPAMPTQRLVVTGFYRYVRNPMYIGVVSTVLGQSLLCGNDTLIVYAAIVWLCFHTFVLAYEEPTLKRMFGADYDVFCNHVPRWIPRFTAWSGTT